MDLYLVRHAESLSNVGLVKDHDSDLSPKGIQQAEHLAEHLKNVRFDRIYASHLTRTVRTAAIIAQKQEGCPLITVDPNLSERGTDINYPARVELHKTIYPNLAYTKTSIGTDYHGDAERAEHPLQEYVFSPAYNEATEVTEKKRYRDTHQPKENSDRCSRSYERSHPKQACELPF